MWKKNSLHSRPTNEMHTEGKKQLTGIPSTPSSISSRLKMGTVGSTFLLDFFLSEPFLLDFDLFFRLPPQSEESNPGFLCLGLIGGS